MDFKGKRLRLIREIQRVIIEEFPDEMYPALTNVLDKIRMEYVWGELTDLLYNAEEYIEWTGSRVEIANG